MAPYSVWTSTASIRVMRLHWPSRRHCRTHASLRSIVPIDHFELIFNGRVIASHRPDGARTQADVNGKVEIPASGWLVLRAWNDHADPKVQDIYPYASTSPIYVTVDRQAPRSPEDATYFVSWLDRVIAGATARSDYNSAAGKAEHAAIPERGTNGVSDEAC